MNNVSIVGRTTRDIETKYIPSGKSVCSFSVAISRKYTQDGEQKEDVSFIEVQAWGKTAENVAKYVSKGNRIAISGSLKQDRWEQDGNKRSKLYVVAHQVEFLESKKQEEKVSSEQVKWDE